MNIENAFNKLGDKLSTMVDNVKSSSNIWKKMGRIGLIIFFIVVAMIPFFIYFMFFAKDRTIDVKVKGELKNVENNDNVDEETLKKANKKANKILKNVKK